MALGLKQANVAVVGAGAAGLAAAREMLREGHRVAVFEQSAQLGGVWVYDEAVEDDPLGQRADRTAMHGSMYETLRTNLPRELMGFADLPFTPEMMQGFCKDHRRFPRHEEVLRYLQAYAARFNLVQHIRFGTAVQRAEPVAAADGQTAWRVTTATQTAHQDGTSQGAAEGSAGNGGAAACRNGSNNNGSMADSSGSGGAGTGVATYDALVVCNGHYAVPRVPPIEGIDSFAGRCEHSHNYRRPDGYTGLRVVTVGAHASGEDIARDVAGCAEEVVMSAKSWRKQELAWQKGPFGAHSNMFRRPWPSKLCSDGSVEFEDGSRLADVDVVMFCTGYHYSAHFLDESIVDTDNSHVDPLYRHLVHPDFGGSLSFIGIPLKIVPFPQFELQTKLIARVLSGAAELPSVEDMQDWMQQHYGFFREAGLPNRHIHVLGGHQWEYNDWLADRCGSDVPHTPQWRLQLWQDACALRGKYEPDAYRDKWENPESLQQAHAAFEEQQHAHAAA